MKFENIMIYPFFMVNKVNNALTRLDTCNITFIFGTIHFKN